INTCLKIKKTKELSKYFERFLIQKNKHWKGRFLDSLTFPRYKQAGIKDAYSFRYAQILQIQKQL
ncbi:hypothetical protein, partial [Flavobacterium soyangense]|uniref:hypothetical protein n=1 Tax=Flavobacterium soyangense TaxID=2023265 RepID=UPI001E3BB777